SDLPGAKVFGGVNRLDATVPGNAAVVIVCDERAPDFSEGNAAVGVEQVRLVSIDQVADAVEPDLVERGIRRVPGLRTALVRLVVFRVIEIGVLRIGAVVVDADPGPELVVLVARVPPVVAGAEMLRD